MVADHSSKVVELEIFGFLNLQIFQRKEYFGIVLSTFSILFQVASVASARFFSLFFPVRGDQSEDFSTLSGLASIPDIFLVMPFKMSDFC